MIKRVKNKLWQYGYRAVDVSKLNVGCDLIISNKYRMKILTDYPNKTYRGLEYYAIVKNRQILFAKKLGSDMVMLERSPLRIIPRHEKSKRNHDGGMPASNPESENLQ